MNSKETQADHSQFWGSDIDDYDETHSISTSEALVSIVPEGILVDLS